MRQLLLSTLLLFLSFFAFAQSTGDLSFIALNADGNDGFAMVTWVDVPASTNILFRDEEWDGTAFGTGEGQAEWNTGAAIIPAGTLILFQDLSTPTPFVSFGSLSNTDIGISGTSEGIFCFLGTDTQTPTTFLCAIGNAGEATAFGTLAGTGLNVGTTAITLPSGVDIAEYTGPRSGLDVNGYQIALNDNANYLTQDGSGDQHNDGIEPDEPFDQTMFEISSVDLTAPVAVAATVLGANSVQVTFSEEVTMASATATVNYLFAPEVTINTITYDAAANSAVISHSGFTTAVAYTLTVNNLTDLAGNTQITGAVFTDLLVNAQLPNLRITEIMYNPPAGADSLEFIELWNFDAGPIELGGLVLRDEANFVFALPAISLAANTALLLATDGPGATAFYGTSFINLPGSGNLLSNGGEALQLLNSLGEVIDSVDYDDAAPWPTAADGNGPSIELTSPDNNQNNGTSWTAATNLVGQVAGSDVFATPGTLTVQTRAAASFTADHGVFLENAGTVSIPVAVTGNTGAGSVGITIEATNGVAGTDFELLTTTLDLSVLPAGDTTLQVSVRAIDNAVENGAVWVSLLLTFNGVDEGSTTRFVLYLNDEDAAVPVASNTLELDFKASYLVEDGGSAEILAHDAVSDRLFVVNSVNTKLHILDFSNPAAMTELDVIDISTYGTGITSVATNDGIVAVSVDAPDFADGSVVFFNTNGEFIRQVTVGNLPDHVSFTPNGQYLLTANEGQPNDAYTIDPEGSVSIIDLSGGVAAATVTTANFNGFDAMVGDLRAAGVRIFGPGASLSQDMEPEYIAYSSDNATAYVTCQENNALAVVDISSGTITDILPLGFKDYQLTENAFDFSDRTDTIIFANWPVKGMYQPDALAYFEVDGQAYLITANEGDSRDYGGYSEEERIGGLNLDPTAFPNADLLQENAVLGRLNATTANGDTDGDGDYDQIYTYGARSVSVWDATTGALVWDSGSALERLTAADPVYGALFNASNSNNNYKNRSDDKGPEPEAVTTAVINGTPYAFIGLERVGGIVVYDLSDPTAPVFTGYVNNRTLGDDEGGDLGPEGLLYLSPDNSPTDTGLVIVANEVSATVSVYTIVNDVTTGIFAPTPLVRTLKVYPNPTQEGIVYFERPVTYQLFDVQGRQVLAGANAAYANVANLSAGMYVLKTTTNETVRIIVGN